MELGRNRPRGPRGQRCGPQKTKKEAREKQGPQRRSDAVPSPMQFLVMNSIGLSMNWQWRRKRRAIVMCLAVGTSTMACVRLGCLAPAEGSWLVNAWTLPYYLVPRVPFIFDGCFDWRRLVLFLFFFRHIVQDVDIENGSYIDLSQAKRGMPKESYLSGFRKRSHG